MDLLSADACLVLPTCLHKCCEACLDKLLSTDPKCPLCFAPFKRRDVKSQADLAAALEDDVKEAAAASDDVGDEVEVLMPADAPAAPKIQALLEGLREMTAQGEDRKAVVFSTFPSFLRMIEHAVQAAGYRTVILHGGLTSLRRRKAVASFRIPNTEGGPQVCAQTAVSLICVVVTCLRAA